MDRVYNGLQGTDRPLNAEQSETLQAYRNGQLLELANEATLESGHGRLKTADGKSVDIGGSTGGLVCVVLDDWEPAKTDQFR